MTSPTLRARSPLLSEEDRRDIARRAATLYECLREPGTAGASLTEGRAILGRWAEAFSPGDRAAFARRLAWDGLDEAAVLHALTAPAAAGPPPDWTAWLDRFLDEAATLATIDAAAEIAALTPSREPPFVEVWAAMVRAARKSVLARVALDGIRPEAMAALERALVFDLSAAGELALLERFQAFEGGAGGARYPVFVEGLLSGGLSAVFRDLPVLARQLATLAATWADSTVELLERLRRDRAAIAALVAHAAPGDVTAAAPGLSDRHHGGRRVSVLTFESGRRVVYKPRDTGLERAYQEFLRGLAARGLLCAPPAYGVVERDGYGWAEHVEQQPASDRAQVAEYFRRAGAAACVLHVLRGADAHQENVVATAAGPVLVDSEMLLQPVDADEERDAASDGPIDGAAHGVPRSCLSSGFVTFLDLDACGVAYDVGGLMPASPRAALGAFRSWRGLRSDGLRYESARTVAPALANDVVLDGVVQRPEAFAEEILAGFAETYRFLATERDRLLAADGPLSVFAGRRSRILFRPSEQYGFFLHALFAPRYQRRGLDRSVALEMLGRVFQQEETRPRLWPLVAEERDAMEALDVPTCSLPAAERVLAAASGAAVGGHLVRSGLEAVTAGVRALGEADLGRQEDTLRAALEVEPAVDVARPAAGAARDPRSTLLAAATVLGDRIVARARRAGDGTLRWSAEDARERDDLYRGRAGIGLFLAALAAVTEEGRFAEASGDALRPLVRVPDGASTTTLGACSGLGSVAYALAAAGRLLGDRGFSESACRWAGEITPARIAADAYLDVASGTAGALLALLALDEPGAPSWIRDRVRDCARHLVATQTDTGGGGGAWAGSDGLARAGFAHGAAGIAYALGRAGGGPEMEEAVRRAHRHERRMFSPAAGNWPALHEGGTILMTAWCHGAPGIGLARALGLDAFDAFDDGEALRAEIRTALETTAAAPPARTDHLCCGDMGRSEALLVLGTRMGNARAVAAAQEMATRLAERVCAQGTRGVRTEGFAHRTFPPGFFRGLAGIGYQLLRTAAPERLPSVLGFEPAPRIAP